jgi:hypothetical protein
MTDVEIFLICHAFVILFHSGVNGRVLTVLIIRVLTLAELLKVWERDVTI